MKSHLKETHYRKQKVSRGPGYVEGMDRQKRRRVSRDPMEQQRLLSSNGTPITFAPLLALAVPFLKGALTAGAAALGGAAVKGLAEGITARTQQWQQDKMNSLDDRQKRGGDFIKSGVDLLANRISGGEGGVEGAVKNWVSNVGKRKPIPKPPPPEPEIEMKPTPNLPGVAPRVDPQQRWNPRPPMQTSAGTAIGHMATGRPVSRRPPPIYEDEDEYPRRYSEPPMYDDYPRPYPRRYSAPNPRDYEGFDRYRPSNYAYE